MIDPLLWTGDEVAEWNYWPSANPPAIWKPRRVRRRSIERMEKQAAQAGKTVVSVTDHLDGARTFTFGQSTTASGRRPQRMGLRPWRTFAT